MNDEIISYYQGKITKIQADEFRRLWNSGIYKPKSMAQSFYDFVIEKHPQLLSLSWKEIEQILLGCK